MLKDELFQIKKEVDQKVNKEQLNQFDGLLDKMSVLDSIIQQKDELAKKMAEITHDH